MKMPQGFQGGHLLAYVRVVWKYRKTQSILNVMVLTTKVPIHSQNAKLNSAFVDLLYITYMPDVTLRTNYL